MNEEQYKALVEKVGKEVAERIKAEIDRVESNARKVAQEAVANSGMITKTTFDEYKKVADEAINEIKEIARKQGVDISALTEKINTNSAVKEKTISEMLKAKEEEMRKVYAAGVGTVEFMIQQKADGRIVMSPFDRTKAAGTTATIDGLDGGGGVASVTQNLLSSTLLRVGGNAEIVSQFRNTPWIFGLVNTTNAEYISSAPFAMWWEEQAKEGASTTVAEGGTKPKVQYSYDLKSAAYKKEAQLISITEEFSIDFRRLEDDIMGKGRIDLLNAVNDRVVTNIINAATAYNTNSSFGSDIPHVNDFDAIAAMAAQVENATKGNMANAAIMSTFKKYRMGITKSEMGEYLNRPDVINNISFIGNPGMAADAIVVGDLRQYNLILRGGLIIKVGYNGTDFAENKFSVVMEQFYYDYISNIRKVAIVKGPDFATVKGLIGEDVS